MKILMSKLRKVIIWGLFLVFTCFLAGLPGRAEAVSVGPYVDLAGGSGEFEWDYSGYEFDVDTSTAAVGFALDTDPFGKNIFSYRLNVGFEEQVLEDDFGL